MILHSLLSYTITQYFVYECMWMCVSTSVCIYVYRACIAVCRQKVPYYSNLASDEHSAHARNSNGDTRIIYGSPFYGKGLPIHPQPAIQIALRLGKKSIPRVYLPTCYIRTPDVRRPRLHPLQKARLVCLYTRVIIYLCTPIESRL